LRAAIPVRRIGEVALFAVQVRMHPRTGGIVDVLSHGMRAVPVAAGIVPERPQGRRHRRRNVRGQRCPELVDGHTRVLVPTTSIAMPPAMAASPTMGEKGIRWCFSVVACTGPMSSTLS